MDFESVADELYGVERAEFTPLRDRRAKEAREAGEKDLAKRIGGLRKPTTAAWLVNRLARARPCDLGELGELGEALRQAHSELAGDELRALSRQRHDLVRTLTEQAVGNTGVGESVVREVSETLEAALADPETGEAVAEGRLTSALRPGSGFSGEWMATGPAPARPPKAAKAGKAGSRPERKPDDDSAQRRQEERERERRRKEELKQARAALSEARSARDAAASELRAAEREEAKARKRTETARKELDKASSRLDRAEEDVETLS